MADASANIEIFVPIHKVWDVVTNFAAYPEFISEMKRAKVLRRDETSMRVECEVFKIKKVMYTIDVQLGEPTTMSWSLIKSNTFKTNDGGWILEDLGDGVTKATYSVAVDFAGLIRPPQSVVDKLTQSDLPSMLKSFKKRAEELYG